MHRGRNCRGRRAPRLLAGLLGVATLLTVLVGISEPASAIGVIVVTTASDTAGGDCSDPASMTCSLRDAITLANTDPAADTIEFDIEPGGIPTITLASALPQITEDLTIDGSTQPGVASGPGIELDGGNIVATGFDAGANAAATIRGMAIYGFTDFGIAAITGPAVIEDNYIGTDTAGTSAVGPDTGIAINGFAGFAGSRIIGNWIVGPASPAGTGIDLSLAAAGAVVQGNHIGLSPVAPSTLLGQFSTGISTIAGGEIGGASATEANTIVGSAGPGITTAATFSSVRIRGNFIGTDATGAPGLGNGGAGIEDHGALTAIGGSNPGEGNVIAGNGGPGIDLRAQLPFQPGPGCCSNTVIGNLIGITPAGPLGNVGAGISVRLQPAAAGGVLPGVLIMTNEVAFNAGDGVEVRNGAGSGSFAGAWLEQNSIHDNGGLGIDLGPDGTTANDVNDVDTGANGLQNFPVVTAVTTGTVDFTLSTVPTTPGSTPFDVSTPTYTVEVFTSPTCDDSGHGEGRTFRGRVENLSVPAGGVLTVDDFAVTLPPAHFVTLTATSHESIGFFLPPRSSTSEFSACLQVPGLPNVPPVAGDDSYTAVTGEALSVPAPGVLDNDSDSNGDALQAIVVTSPANAASFTFNPDGSFDYTSTPDFTGTDTFTYEVTDGFDTDLATVTIQVSPPNAAPVATDDAYDATTSVPLVVPAPGVLANDSDPDGGILQATLVSGPANAASFTLDADGSFTYTSNPGFTGADTFTYTADDGLTNSEVATVTVTVTAPVNGAPVATDDAYSATTGAALVALAPGVLANDSDPDGDTLQATLVSGPAHAASFTFNTDGSFTYASTLGFTGADTFTYSAGDGTADSDVATVTVTVRGRFGGGTGGGSGGGGSGSDSGGGEVGPVGDGDDFWLTVGSTQTLPTTDGGTLEAKNEDVLGFDADSGTYRIVFDGSAVGLAGAAIDGLARLPEGDLVLSLTASFRVPGIGRVADEDLIRFTPTSLGPNATSGRFTLFFDGSDIGLTRTGEDIDAVDIRGGTIYFSTTGDVSVRSGGRSVRGHDEDVIACRDATLGARSACAGLSLAFNGSRVSFNASGEDVDALSLTDDQAFLSTEGSFSVPGASGRRKDVMACLGSFPCTSGFTVVFRGEVSALPRNVTGVEFNL